MMMIMLLLMMMKMKISYYQFEKTDEKTGDTER